MNASRVSVVLRAREPSDEELLAHVYASTREDELAVVPFSDGERAAFIAQQFAAQSAHFANHYSDASYDVVEIDGVPAGRLIVLRSESEILVVDIALLPEHRGRGVGTSLIEAILEEADDAGMKVALYVESFNRAQRLYERLGFTSVATNGVYFQMERVPRSVSGEDGLVAGTGTVGSEGDQEDVERPEAGVLEPVDLLDEHRLDGSSERDAERRADARLIDRGGAGVVGLRADQLEVQPKGVGMRNEGVTDQRGEVVQVEPVQHAADPNRGFTRRRALQIGAMTALSAMWAGPSLAKAATNSTPLYLRRASYTGLVGKSFTIDGGSFTLASVSDLAGAAKDASLRGHDEAFVLEFDGAAGELTSGIHSFSHPDLGSFSMFASPVEATEGQTQRYEVVVDRSVGRPADPPEPSEPPKPAMTEAEKEAAAEELLASTPIHEIPGAPVPAKVARKRKAKHKRRHHKAKHVKAKHPKAKRAKPKRKPVGRRTRSRRHK
jgi:ribosomal protein S18 acetylase RimI-like enzyme